MLENFDPITLMAVLAALSVVPFLAIMVTSFVKLVVVFFLIRNALGVQQVPPNMAMHGLAIILSAYVMYPVGQEIYDKASQKKFDISDPKSVIATIKEVDEPFKRFLRKHSKPMHKKFFIDAAEKLWSPGMSQDLDEDSFMVLVPAFTVSQLTSAFQIGFLIYLPFIAIDLIISNILLAMGMMMVSPMTISLPFKLFLFVMVEGWTRLVQGLVLSYQ